MKSLKYFAIKAVVCCLMLSIDGAVISEETDPVTPKSGEIEGFSDLVD